MQQSDDQDKVQHDTSSQLPQEVVQLLLDASDGRYLITQHQRYVEQLERMFGSEDEVALPQESNLAAADHCSQLHLQRPSASACVMARQQLQDAQTKFAVIEAHAQKAVALHRDAASRSRDLKKLREHLFEHGLSSHAISPLSEAHSGVHTLVYCQSIGPHSSQLGQDSPEEALAGAIPPKLHGGASPLPEHQDSAGMDVAEQSELEGSSTSDDLDSEAKIANEVKDSFRRLLVAQRAFDVHQTSHRGRLRLFKQKRDPRLRGWSPAWTRDDFEKAFLRDGSKFCQDLIAAERDQNTWLGFAGDAGLSPPFWQTHNFRQPEDFVPTDADEQAAIQRAPAKRILVWREEVKRLTAPEETEDVVMSDIDSYDETLPESKELQPWDSFSCVAVHRYRKMIDSVAC